MNVVKNYFHGLVEEGFAGYFKERKVLYGFIALMLFFCVRILEVRRWKGGL